VIRRGTPDDMDSLIDICHDSFPESLLWNSPRFFGRKWWKSVIASKSGEAWICINGERIAGFCVLITNTGRWNSEKSGRDMNLFALLLAAAFSPRFAIRRVREKIAGIGIASADESLSTTPCNDNGTDTWIGLIAVSPQMRGRGFAKKMLQFCEERTLQLHRNAIKLVVIPSNKSACRLYEGQGFIRTTYSSIGYVYKKVPGKQQGTTESNQQR